MGLISPQQVSDATTADASDVNNPINTIANEFNGNIDNANIKTGAAIATAKLASDNGITGAMLSTSAITLGYAQITTSYSNTSVGFVKASTLGVTVTIPAGGRKIKITAWTRALQNNTSAANTAMCIYDGADPGSGVAFSGGTQLSETYHTASGVNTLGSAACIAVVTPAAGSKTYNVGILVSAGTGTITASATAPAFILVEAI